MLDVLKVALALIVAVYVLRILWRRLLLSRAKHRSLTGHGRIARRLARLVPFYAYADDEVFGVDGADPALQQRRRQGFAALRERLLAKSEQSRAASKDLAPGVSDMQFTSAYRVPFQFRRFVMEQLPLGSFVNASDGVQLRDLDGNWSFDLGGSYGVNLLGYDFYKGTMERALERTKNLGPVLGPYHPLIAENVERIRRISGLDEVSFHMSGTEAVMQAVRLARYHTRRPKLAMFCGAYHGWWDGVQPGVGSQRGYRDILNLQDMSAKSLAVLKSRNDIACLLINPLQALHPNKSATSDAMLVGSERKACYDKQAYAAWLQELRRVCTDKGIALIFDEVFVGFRLAQGGAQEYFGVRADLVTYGKTIGGGLPVGVIAGRHELMRRYRDNSPTDICFARGTFNSHPMVMAAMNEFLQYADTAEYREQVDAAEAVWNRRFAELNDALAANNVPVHVYNMVSIGLVGYSAVSRYNWLLQYYLRAEGLSLSWVGTGRFIFSHNYTDVDFATVVERIVAAGQRMRDDGWWDAPDGLTNKAIKRQVLREMLRSRFGRRTDATAAPRLTSNEQA
ncbi:MAG: aminotransferase class III-fold pyridoxal phosphate-dependent enzyme [Pseudomonadota bacterium]